jgi:hypothetical protein
MFCTFIKSPLLSSKHMHLMAKLTRADVATYMAVAAFAISIAFLYISLTALRETFTGTAEQSVDKLLLEESDLPAVKSSVREAILESDGGEFLTQQLELLKTTREIYGELLEKMATNLAAADESRDVAAYKQAAIEKISSETGGMPARFCDDVRVEGLLNADADVGALERLVVCLPDKPAKYLVLLSYAAKTYMKQVDAAKQSLGGSYAASVTASNEPAVEMPSFPPDATEGFSTASAQAPAASASLVSYTSSYRLDTPSKSSSEPASLLLTPFDRRLIAWKAAYNAESMKRIKAYLKYINWARKQTTSLQADLQSGAMTQQLVGPRAPLA